MNSSIFEFPYYDISGSEFPINRCKGNNARRTLVLVERTDFEEHGVLLTKILRAVDLDFEQDVSFITLEKDETVGLLNSSIAKQFDYVLLFGIAPRQIGLMTTSRLSMLRLENHTIIVSTLLSMVSKDAKAKRILWSHLKEVFKQ